MDNDLPITRLSELFNVNHFIVSQVNPHIAPFLPREELLSQSELTSSLPWSLLSHSTTETEGATGPGWGERLTKLALGEIMHRMNILAEIGIMRTPLTKARSVLAQKYSGDITLLPEVNLSEFPRLLKNPTTEFMKDAILRGERATWPKLSRIANHCAVEIALDKAILQLRAKVLFDSGDIDARVGSWAGLGVEGANIGGVAKGSGDWSTQRRNGAERRLRMQSSGPIELSTMAKLRSNGVIFRMPVDPDSKNGRAMRDLQMNRKGPSSPTLSRGPMSKSMLNLPHDGTTNNGPFASSTSGSSSVHKGITPPRHPNQHRRTGPPVCSDDPIKVSYRDVGASGSTLYPDDESSTEGEQQEFEGGKGQSRSGYQSPGKRRRLSFSSSKPDTTSSTQNTSVYQNGDALRGSRSTPSLAYDDMFPHRHLSSQSPQAKRGGSRDYYNNNTNDTQGYFSYSPATPQPHHWSQYSGFGLTMTPSISNSPEVNYSRSVAASGMISPGGSARVYATPLLSTTPPHSETAMVDLDVSGTRGMLRRRRSVGQLQLLNSFAASTLALLQPVVTPASQTSTTEMNDSGVGGGLGVKVGLGRAKSAEQLRGR